ncbi:hypothetical protein D3C84_733110 [compost metagenome]
MSIISRNIIRLFIFIFTFFCYSQEHSEKKEIVVYFDLKDKAINSCFVKTDSSEAHFSIYTKGFETQKSRNHAIKKFKKTEGDPDNRWLPDFTISFISFSKPEKLKTIKEVNYLTLNEFRSKLFPQGYPMYFVYKSEKGYYLKWEVTHIEY